MINYSSFYNQLNTFGKNNEQVLKWLEHLPEDIDKGLSAERFGDLPEWFTSLSSLPKVPISTLNLKNEVSLGRASDISKEQFILIENAFKQLIPWRKGPFTLFDQLNIDTEWRSDWKWDRVLPHLNTLNNARILDVGCGNGYHALRMAGAGAKHVIGIDPSPRFVVQFYMLKHFLESENIEASMVDVLPVDVLPLTLEQLPNDLNYFDLCFSMGVLYHRRSPIDHLLELKQCLRPKGELVLETLVIDGGINDVLVPEGRYAKMRNVWFLPSVPHLTSWLKKCGFIDIRCADINDTSTDEQRATPWMNFQSLKDFLNPENETLTIEGHPAPKRAIIIARKP